MTDQTQDKNCVYIFLDEGGNLDFSQKGTKFYTMSTITTVRPFHLHVPLDDYIYDLIEWGKDIEYFHCADDNKHVREKVFSIIIEQQDSLRVDSIVIEKRKTGPALQEAKKFYPKMLGYLLRYVVEQLDRNFVAEIIVITDSIPVARKKQAIEKAIKQTLAEMLPVDCKYRIFHHASRSHFGLQIADYCNWAIFRRWESEDDFYKQKISECIKSEFNIFRSGSTYYY